MEVDTTEQLERFCSTCTDADVVRFIAEQQPGTTFYYQGREYTVRGYRCYPLWYADNDWQRVFVVTDEGCTALALGTVLWGKRLLEHC